jgi:hypothetical protein
MYQGALRLALMPFALVAGAVLMSDAVFAQAACPPGYDGSCGYCIPSNSGPQCGYRGRRGGYYDDGPRYGHRYGAPCPPGYDGSSGRCVPGANYGGGTYYRQGYGTPCPPGYDGRSGRCLPNR